MISTSVLLPLLVAIGANATPVQIRPRQGRNTDVGSDAWKAQYPKILAVPDPAEMPQAWKDKLDEVVAAGLLPEPYECPIATMGSKGFPVYGDLDPQSANICSASYNCHPDTQDILSAPNGTIGISQDDGPLPDGSTLYDFFKQENISATHFYIGSNIIQNSDVFLQARALPGQQMACHTWSHPYPTLLTNEEVVAEIGWTLQILADSNYGKVPNWWRPPYGDIDNRVRAITKHVFGLHNVLWNVDSLDWAIGSSKTKDESKMIITDALSGPKSPGLIILEHELNPSAVQNFIETYPTYKENGWTSGNIAEVFGLPWYRNALSDKDPGMPGTIVPDPKVFN